MRIPSSASRPVDSLVAALARCGLGAAEPGARAAAAAFPPRISAAWLARVRRGDPHDPLLLQVLPTAAELATPPDYSQDPLAEGGFTAVPGVLHKYAGRALLLCDGPCALHCRFCFRRGEGRRLARGPGRAALDYIRRRPDLREVILSGGDPLGMPTDTLCALLRELDSIGHLRRIRLHTRYPVADPRRVDAALAGCLQTLRARALVVLHVNHPRELGALCAGACARLRRAGASLLSQSVLLRGINDRPEVLEQLYERLDALGVLPYYLHQLDRVHGAAHFAVSDAQACELIAALRARLPGYLVPRLVREIPGRASKSNVGAVGPCANSPDC